MGVGVGVGSMKRSRSMSRSMIRSMSVIMSTRRSMCGSRSDSLVVVIAHAPIFELGVLCRHFFYLQRVFRGEAQQAGEEGKREVEEWGSGL